MKKETYCIDIQRHSRPRIRKSLGSEAAVNQPLEANDLNRYRPQGLFLTPPQITDQFAKNRTRNIFPDVRIFVCWDGYFATPPSFDERRKFGVSGAIEGGLCTVVKEGV